MPYFAWKGVDIIGTVHKGYLSAFNTEQLQKRLYERNIALISSRQAYRWQSRQSYLVADRVRLFNTLSLLLSSGVVLPNACILASDQMKYGFLQDALISMAGELYEGMSLSACFMKYPHLFNALTIQLIKAGEESGNLSQACKGIADYYHVVHECSRRIRSSLIMPGITLLFFTIICFFIVLVIVPQFAFLYQSMNNELPWLTHMLYKTSTSIRTWSIIPSILIVILSCSLIKKLCKRKISIEWMEYIFFHIPFINRIMIMQIRHYFFHACSFLLQGGIPLMNTLHCIKQANSSILLNKLLEQVIVEIMDGNSFSTSLYNSKQALFDAESIAIIQAGQESGNLSKSCSILAQRYYEQLIEGIHRLTIVIQPTVIIMLGIMITGLLLALYLPVLNLSTTYHQG